MKLVVDKIVRNAPLKLPNGNQIILMPDEHGSCRMD